VVVRVDNSREFVALLFGTLRLGAVFVPINPQMKPYHLRQVLDDAQPRLVIAQDAPAVFELTPRPVWPLEYVREMLRTAGYSRRRVPAVDPDPDRLALLIYTSGSTSAPKAVMSTHRPVLFAARAIARRLRYRADDVVLTAIPLSSDYGLYQVFLAFLAGAELVVTSPDAHVGLLAALRVHRATIVPIVPSLGEMLVRLAGRNNGGEPLPVRMFTNTGAALTAPLIAGLRRTFPNASVVAMFGTTECKRITVDEPDGDLLRPGSCGRALDGTEVLILDDSGEPLPPGQIGEIVVRGPHLMSGYWRSPQLTQQRFRRDPRLGLVLHTGDYGHLDAEGYLYFSGRRDDLFKRRGLRVSALEIEAAARDIDGVREAAVLPPSDGRDVVLFAVTDLDGGVVLKELGKRLEGGKVPPVCHVRDALPLTPNGKTDKRQLAALLDAAGQED
jgi:acyl-CoA synthetase (AMP-forming)/AMP-acid ligase II